MSPGDTIRRSCLPLLLILPAALTVYLAFNSGGMFEVTTAFAAVVVLTVTIVAVALAAEPLRGLSAFGAIAVGLLTCYALWTVLSSQWSHAGGRSLVAFDRVLLYLAVLVLFACVPRTEARFRLLLRGLLVGSAVVALAGLTSRLLPGWWPTTTGLVEDRLSYPVTYWNTFALLVGMACILAVHHACDEREPAAMRICGAALLPLLGVTLLLTFSRGAILVTVVGIVAYLAIARPYSLLGGLLAAGPATAIALAQTYSAQSIHEGTPLTPAAIAEGKHVALVVCACALAAALLRALALPLDSRVATFFSSPASRRRGGRAIAIAGAALALMAFLVAGGPSALDRQYHHFVDNTQEASATDGGQRNRLLEVGNDGRLPMWEVAEDGFRRHPADGTGAGTFQVQWQRHRSTGPERLFAYSLYLEALGELGLVGILLLGGSLLAILAGIAWRCRGPGRSAYAAAFALTLAWALHSGLDIDWQSPVVCVPVFALGGLALARLRRVERQSDEAAAPSWVTRLVAATSGGLRPVLALACLAVAVVPGRMALAQSDLHDSVQALSAGECGSARADAHDSISMLDTGPRPYEVLAMCAARGGEMSAGVRWARKAVTHDPDSWEPHYVLALAQASAGDDPRLETRRAAAADPLSRPPGEAMAAFSTTAAKQWPSTAAALPFAME